RRCGRSWRSSWAVGLGNGGPPVSPTCRPTRNAGGSAAMRALILQHEEPTPPGHVTEWLDGHGADVETLRIDLDGRDVDPIGYDLIVSLGSEAAAFDDSRPFVP